MFLQINQILTFSIRKLVPTSKYLQVLAYYLDKYLLKYYFH